MTHLLHTENCEAREKKSTMANWRWERGLLGHISVESIEKANGTNDRGARVIG